MYITDGVATPYPGTGPSEDAYNDADSGSGLNGKAVFTGGHTYTVTGSEETILEAAGYSIDGDES